MSRLIDADELKKHKYHSDITHENVVSVAQIDWMPTIQAVPIDVLKEIQQEIEERINNCGDGTFKDGLCEAFDIIYNKIEELSE